MLDFEEKALCRKVAGVLELSAKRGYEPFAFAKLWLASKTAQNLYEWDFKDVAQSKQYLLHSIELEYNLGQEAIHENIQENTEYVADVMYWGGYIFMYFSLENKIKPQELLDKYDIVRILQCYDTLHTVSSKVAVEMIDEDFRLQCE
jgi:hypothetical protein